MINSRYILLSDRNSIDLINSSTGSINTGERSRYVITIIEIISNTNLIANSGLLLNPFQKYFTLTACPRISCKDPSGQIHEQKILPNMAVLMIVESSSHLLMYLKEQ